MEQKQKTIYVYQCHICQIGGVETFLYNWCYELRHYYDITVFYSSADPLQLERLQRLVKTRIYNPNETYTCDIFLRNSVWGRVPDNFISTDGRYLEMRHADYKWLLDRGVLYEQYHKFNKTNEVIACAEHVGRKSHEVLGDNPTTILNILKELPPKKLRLISCTRIDSQKGWDRMKKMAYMMNAANIDFHWDIYTNGPTDNSIKQIIFHKQTFDIWDELRRADYCVLLSNAEGCPYTVLEALQCQVPCIVTAVDGCMELIKDGINGYVVPLDMNFDIKKILNIPKCQPYDNKAKEKWIELLGNPVYIHKELRGINMVLVEALDTYEKMGLKDGELKCVPKRGYRWKINEQRLDTLLGSNKYHATFVKLIQEDDIEENNSI